MVREFRRLGFIVAGFLALAWSAVAAEVQTRSERIAASGAAGDPVLLREHAAWDSDCQGIPYPAIRLDRPPRHGAVCARVANVTVRSLYTDTEDQCVGHVVRGLRLFYLPRTGFTGDDRLEYSVQYPDLRRTVTVSVAVGGAPDRTAPATVGSGAEPAQAPGPVPPCAAPMS